MNKGTNQQNLEEPETPVHNSLLNINSSFGFSVSKFQGNETRNGTGVFLGGRLSNDAAVAFGGISPPTKGARTSSRIRLQENADDTQMERAQKFAKAKDVVSSLCTSLTKDKGLAAGTPQPSKFSLCSISDDIIISRAEKIGVSFGSSPSMVSKLVKNIKDSDNTRTLIMLSKNLAEKNIDDEGRTHNTTFDQANGLSVDLMEESNNLEEHNREPVVLEKREITRVYKRREKVKPKVVRRSARLSKK
jgi:hypothetical protein